MAWPFDSEDQLDEWVDAYIVAHHTQARDKDEEQASYLASEPGHLAIHHGHAEVIWRFVLKVVARRPSEWTLEMLAAGPLEDLIAMCGEDFIERIEVEARRNPVFRETLHGVWQSTTSESLWARVERARGPSPQAP